jgi:hypothetical protein
VGDEDRRKDHHPHVRHLAAVLSRGGRQEATAGQVIARKVLRLTVTPMRHGYLLRAEGDARSAWDGTDVIADGTLDEVLAALRELVLTEIPAARPAPPLRPVAVPDPVPGAAK